MADHHHQLLSTLLLLLLLGTITQNTTCLLLRLILGLQYNGCVNGSFGKTPDLLRANSKGLKGK